ncbi:MAG: type II toxin-antitoxin system HicB family antitoxin [Acidobacteriota bacterium]
MVKEYVVIYERGSENEENWSAYVPDLPGCVSTGETFEESQDNIREAIQLHLEGMKAEGLPIPEPTTKADRVSVAA